MEKVYDLKLKSDHSSRMHPDLPEKPGGPDNWVEQVGGLPSFIKRVAKHIFYDSPGMTVSHAIAAAVEQCKKWAAKGNPKAAAAIAQWEAKRAASHAKTAVKKAAKHKLSDNDDEEKYIDLGLLIQRRSSIYSVAGNSVSARGTGVKGSSYDETKHPRTTGGQFGAKISAVDLMAARRKIEAGITNLRPGEAFTLPNKVGWVKRMTGGSYFVQGNGGYTASVRTISEAIQAAALLLVKRGTRA